MRAFICLEQNSHKGYILYGYGKCIYILQSEFLFSIKNFFILDKGFVVKQRDDFFFFFFLCTFYFFSFS